MTEFDQFFRGYLTAALWSSTDSLPDDPEGNNPVHLDSGDYEWGEGQEDALKRDALDFFTKHRALLDQYTERRLDPDDPSDGISVEADGTVWDYAGHDFWLTRAGHGVGFWDRGLGDLGKQLSTLVGHGTEFPNIDLYLGDDLKVYAAGMETPRNEN